MNDDVRALLSVAVGDAPPPDLTDVRRRATRYTRRHRAAWIAGLSVTGALVGVRVTSVARVRGRLHLG